MKKATIDLTDCKYLIELHERIINGLNLPNDYGRNWYAFWDEINRNIEFNFITVKGSQTVTDELKEKCNAVSISVALYYIKDYFPNQKPLLIQKCQ